MSGYYNRLTENNSLHEKRDGKEICRYKISVRKFDHIKHPALYYYGNTFGSSLPNVFSLTAGVMKNIYINNKPNICFERKSYW